MSSRRILTSTRLERKKKEKKKTKRKNNRRRRRKTENGRTGKTRVGQAVRDFADYQCVICARKLLDNANKID